MAGPTLMQAVQERLASADPRARIEGVLRVLALSDVRQIEQVLLEAAQRDAHADVRTVAGRALTLLKEWTVLGGTRPEAKVPAEKVAAKFRELLTSPHSKVRLGALTKVLKYKDPSLLPLVEEAMVGEQVAPVLAAMVAVLATMGNERHLASVAACLHHPDARVAAGAAAAAGQLGRDAVLPLLAPLYERQDARILAAVLEVQRVHESDLVWKRLAEWCDCDQSVRRQAVMMVLAQVEDARGVALARRLLAVETDEDLKQAAQEYIDRAAPVTAEGVLERLRNGLGSPDAVMRRRAVDEAREHLTHPEVRALVQVLAQLDPDREVQRAAKGVLEEDLAELVQMSAEESRPSISAVLSPEQAAARQEKVNAKFRNLLTRRQERMRMKAVLKAKKYHEVGLVPVLLERMEVETSPVVLATMLATLADLGSDDHVPLLAPFLGHPNYRVVNGAVLALHRLGGDDVLPLFLPLLARDDPRILSQALIAVMRLNAEQLLDYVRTMAASPREAVRASAITCLARIPLPRVEEILRDMLEREQATGQISRLTSLLADRAGPTSAGPLWALKARRPELERQIHSILEKVVERSGLSIEEVKERGDAWQKSQEQALLQRQKDLAAMPRRTKREPALLDDRRPPPPKWMVFGGFVGLCMLLSNIDWNAVGLGNAPGGIDGMARAQENTWINSQPKPKPIVDLPPTMSIEARARVFETLIDKPVKYSQEQTLSFYRTYLKKLGYANDEYVEMTARGEWRDGLLSAKAEAKKRMEEKDYDGAIRVLTDALAATEPENLLIRQELYELLVRVAIKGGKSSVAKDAMRHAQELVAKITQVKLATKNPFGLGQMAAPEDLVQVQAAGKDLDVLVDAAAKMPEFRAGVTPDAMKKDVADRLETLKRAGKITDADIARVNAEMDRGLASGPGHHEVKK